MNHFVRNKQGWSALLLLPGLVFSGVSYAVPNIQGKITHKIVTPSNNATVSVADSVNVAWDTTSSTYDLNYAYYMLRYVDENGKATTLRPGKNTSMNVGSLDVGTHTFSVRGVHVWTDGKAKFGLYSSPITVNVPNPVIGVQTHRMNAIPSTISHKGTINLSWNGTNSLFRGLNFDQYMLSQTGTASKISYPYNASASVTNLLPNRQYCFKVKGIYKGEFSHYSPNVCTTTFFDIEDETTHRLNAFSNNQQKIGNDLAMSWSANSGFTTGNGISYEKYKIYHRKPGDTQSVITEDSGTSTSLSTNGWVSGEHCFSVAAVSNGIEGNRSAERCITAYSEAQNLFKTGEITDEATTLSTSMCLPKEMYNNWHKEIYSSPGSTASRNGHILGVSKRSVDTDGYIKHGTRACVIEDTDVDIDIYEDAKGKIKPDRDTLRQAVQVTKEARDIINLEQDETNGMLYVKTHACKRVKDQNAEEFNDRYYSCLQSSNNRAELSYDSKNDPDAIYTDELKHTQEGDVFWVTYRFNAISLFEDGVYAASPTKEEQTPGHPNYNNKLVDDGSYVHLSQFHPNTATLPAYDQKTGSDKDCKKNDVGLSNTCGHAPSFAMLLLPVIENGTIDPEHAWLDFRTKFIKEHKDDSNFTDNGVDYLGQKVKIKLKEWYQIKIGIKFSTGNGGWAVAAIRQDGQQWQYFKEAGVPEGSGSLFQGQTLHAPPCRYWNGSKVVDHGPIGADCVSDSQGHFETVFKIGGYFDSTLWHGAVDKHLEILIDDVYAFDSHHDPVHNKWPEKLVGQNDPLTDDKNIGNIGFTPKALTQTIETYPEPCTSAQCN